MNWLQNVKKKLSQWTKTIDLETEQLLEEAPPGFHRETPTLEDIEKKLIEQESDDAK
jgi:hypothetical protein